MGLRKAASQLLLHRPTSICTCLLLKNNTLLDLLKILSFVWWFVQNQVKSFTDNLVKKNILLIRLVLRNQKWIEMALTQMSIYTDLHVYRPVQKNKQKINHQKITHAKLMHIRQGTWRVFIHVCMRRVYTELIHYYLFVI